MKTMRNVMSCWPTVLGMLFVIGLWAAPVAMGQQQMPDSMKAAADSAAPARSVEPAKADSATKEPAATTPAAKPEEQPKLEEKPKAEEQPKAEEKPKTEAAPVDPKAPYKSVTFAKGEKPRIVMETTQGKIVIELWPDVALKHCQSFAYLTEKGYFDSLTFHRVVPGFVIQGGDPKGNGTGGPGYTVPAEFSQTLLHEDGILSMARRGDDINSAGSQFFICLGRLPSLDKQYTIFGKVVEGLDVVHKIEKVPVQGERPVTPVVMTKVSLEQKD
ncbi:MAG: peptidylprolyl isomerase [Candidatus Zixiibacteriota bacterium]